MKPAGELMGERRADEGLNGDDGIGVGAGEAGEAGDSVEEVGKPNSEDSTPSRK